MSIGVDLVVAATATALTQYVRGPTYVLRPLLKTSPLLGGLVDALAALEPKPKHHELEIRLQAASRALQEASDYMTGLQREMQVQKDGLAQAQRDYVYYQQLAATEKEKADAFLKAMSATVETAGRKERRWAFGLGIVSNFVVVFILGVLASKPVKAVWSRFLALF